MTSIAIPGFPSILEIIDALSEHINDELHVAGLPRLTPLLDGQPGRIVIGERHDYDELVPPRIIFRPTTSSFGPRDNTRGPVPLATNVPRPDAESRVAIATRVIHTENMTFEASVWSLGPEGLRDSGAADFVFTRGLYLQLLASLGTLLPGLYTPGGGTWRLVPHSIRVGREFVFPITIALPVLDRVLPVTIPGLPPPIDPATGLPTEAGLPYAPSDVKPEIEDEMVLPDGSSEPGCEG